MGAPGTDDADVARRSDEERLLAAVEELTRQLHPKRRKGVEVELDASLDRDLGIDSMGRAELLLRLEDAFAVRLPDRVLAEAETPRDLLAAVRRAGAAPEAEAAEGGEHERPTEPPAPAAAEPAAPRRAASLLEVVDWHADRSPDQRHVTFLDDEDEAAELTYGELAAGSRAVAAALAAADLEPGDAVGVMLPSGLDYFPVFLGIERAGGVPVPLYPPMRRSQLEDHLERQARILRNARAGLLVAFDEVKPLTRLLQVHAPDVRQVVTAGELLGARQGEAPEVVVEGGDTAFLQYTSGSTGTPKGVVLTHANLLANLRSVGEVLELGGDDVVVSWLPLYHDMGLIGAWMGSLYFGVPLVLMSPLRFLARPIRWLRAIQEHRGTISAAPNFAYSLCLKKITDEDLEGLDLSSWRVALNGAEPVSPDTVERFARRFASCGFGEGVMMPVYGLAEASLAVAFSPPGRGPRIEEVTREAFQRTGRAEPASGDGEAQRFVSSGLPIPGHEVRLVDQQGREVPDREQGRLQFRGPSATSGYFRNREATRRLLRHDGWLDSEDLGFLADGEVFITGRAKDVVIRAGRNIYPEEVEEAVGRLEGLREGGVAVFAVGSEEEGTERLVVAAEMAGEARQEEQERLEKEIAAITSDLVGTAPDEVALLPPRAVPKTSSGKVRRSAARQLYLQGELGKGGRALWSQLVRLAMGGVAPQLGRLGRRLADVLHACWFWGLFAALAPGAWVWVVLLPGRARRRALARRLARLLSRLTGVRVRAVGLDNLPAEGAFVVVSNHQSYLDGFVLSAALPPRLGYAVKRELVSNPFARLPLARLGSVFVERLSPEKGEEETARLVDRLERGDRVVIFPEGTFQRAPGLLPFRMGAFVVAARAGVPVVPVTIRGTRSLLRAGSWFPRRGSALVTVGTQLDPGGSSWDDAVRLRDEVREAMLAHLGEPDLAEAPPPSRGVGPGG